MQHWPRVTYRPNGQRQKLTTLSASFTLITVSVTSLFKHHTAFDKCSRAVNRMFDDVRWGCPTSHHWSVHHACQWLMTPLTRVFSVTALTRPLQVTLRSLPSSATSVPTVCRSTDWHRYCTARHVCRSSDLCELHSSWKRSLCDKKLRRKIFYKLPYKLP